MAKENLKQKVVELINRNRYSKLITFGPDGAPHGRVMTNLPLGKGMVIWFATGLSTNKIKDIKKNPNVSVFVDEGDWFVQFNSRCKYLDKDNRCRIYERRPRICRKYSIKNCEFTGDGEAHDLEFKTLKQIEAYANKKLGKKDKNKSKSGRKK